MYYALVKVSGKQINVGLNARACSISAARQHAPRAQHLGGYRSAALVESDVVAAFCAKKPPRIGVLGGCTKQETREFYLYERGVLMIGSTPN